MSAPKPWANSLYIALWQPPHSSAGVAVSWGNCSGSANEAVENNRQNPAIKELSNDTFINILLRHNVYSGYKLYLQFQNIPLTGVKIAFIQPR
jgi:hypothetical protein